jgi:tetratricopeptide (TPR) repeat protein
VRYDETVRALILALAALAAPLTAQDPLVERAYDQFYNLDFDEALAQFQRAAVLNPNSADLHNHVAQTLVFREMFRNGALESELVSGNNSFLRRSKLNPSPVTEKRFLDEVAKAIALSDARLKSNPRDTAALYSLGISYGLRSSYYWLVKKAWRDGLRDATSARRLHNRVSEIDPANVDARLVQGLHDYTVGSLPLLYRMMGFLVGIRGDREKGIRTIQDVAQNGRYDRVEARVFLCALYRRENQPRRAIPLIQELIRQYPRNFLLRLELSQMYSMAGDKTNALAAVERMAELKRERAPGYDRVPWEKIYFQEGTIEFWYNELEQSLGNMKKVAAAGEDLDLNTGALAYLRMGQIYDLTKRRAEALRAYNNAIAFAPEADAARESKKYISAPYRRL